MRNPRNGESVNLDEARVEEAERLQSELIRTEAQLADLLTLPLSGRRGSGLGLRRLFGKKGHGAPTGDLAELATHTLERSEYPDGFPCTARCVYIPESSMLAVDYTLPPPSVVPHSARYRFVKARGQIVSTRRPAPEIKEMYARVVAQTVLRSLRELFEALPAERVDVITFNGFVQTVDPATGHEVTPFLASVRATRPQIEAINFGRVNAVACLQGLGAVVSRSPSELLSVRPVLDLSMIDPRFVASEDVLGGITSEHDLMELSPNEFEHLITNLFEAMGLQTRQTQASRDGGVDCVAYNTDPVLGGKVVIQAKRYRNTVGVSAVRDLYGTVQNEGASKGILVTTSGYGPAAYEFAKNKPLELFEGRHLLYLLNEHAGIKARIVL